MIDKCDWCGTGIPRTGISQHTTGIRAGVGFLKPGRLYCSNKCKIEGEKEENDSPNKKGLISSFLQSDIEKMADKGLSANALIEKNKIEEAKRKEVEKADAKFYDSIKKILFYKRNREIKELHKRLLEIESDIILALSKENKDKAVQLIKQLQIDSNFFVPNTDISYRTYWENKRSDFLRKLH